MKKAPGVKTDLSHLVNLFKRKVLAAPLDNVEELFIRRRSNVELSTSELKASGLESERLEKAGWIHYNGITKQWEPWGEASDLLHNERPKFDGLFTEIPHPVGSDLSRAGQSPVIEVIGPVDGGKMWKTNVGVVRRLIPFASPAYRMNRPEFEKFLDALDQWVDAAIAWRKVALYPPSAKSKTIFKKLEEARTKFIKRYGNAARALWAAVPQFNPTGMAPFFNPIYFPRGPKDMPLFWRLVEAVNHLFMLPPLAETRGAQPEWTERQYLDIATHWLNRLGDVRIAELLLNDKGSEAVARVKRARLSMGLRRPHLKK